MVINNRAGNYYFSLRELYSVLFAVLPIIMYINVPVINVGLATVVLFAFLPLVFLYKLESKKIFSIIPIFILFLYFAFSSDFYLFNCLFLFVTIIHINVSGKGSIDMNIVKKVMVFLSIFGTFCVVIQYILYFVFGIRFHFLTPNMVAEEFRYYFTTEIKSIYRPSAFFLEPSHYAEYVCLALLFVLFSDKGNKFDLKKVAIIVLGCILTTSGIGIVLCVGVIGWYLLFNKNSFNKKIKYIFIGLIALVIVFFILMQFSFFSMSINRIFGEVDGYNAISGRTWLWDSYIGSLKPNELLMGKGVLDLPGGYMTGAMNLIYCYGYLGMALELGTLLYLFFKSKSTISKCICVIYTGLLFFANLTGFIPTCFWMSIILANEYYYAKKNVNQIV